jgi:hypothetical protein
MGAVKGGRGEGRGNERENDGGRVKKRHQSWSVFTKFITQHSLKERGSARQLIITPPTSSPSLAAVLDRRRSQFGEEMLEGVLRAQCAIRVSEWLPIAILLS